MSKGDGGRNRGQAVLAQHLNELLIGEEACWGWSGPMDKNGYGKVGRRWAHRVVYEELHDLIPDGLQLDHLCRTPACVRPSHLQPVTSLENTLRGNHRIGIAAREDACLRGHFGQWRPNGRGTRTCRICANERSLRRYHRRVAVCAA